MELYEASAAGMEAYKTPAQGTDESVAEWARYEYFGSEIGSLMREQSCWQGSQDLDGIGTIEASEENPLGAPLDLLDDLLTDMKSNWKPEILGAYMTGLKKRFEADPRVTSDAVSTFAASCKSVLGVDP